jgi:hypothetical protein
MIPTGIIAQRVVFRKSPLESDDSSKSCLAFHKTAFFENTGLFLKAYSSGMQFEKMASPEMRLYSR